MELSIVSPCYGAPTQLRQLVDEITKTVAPLTDSYEIILVEDYSPDNSREIIRELCAADAHIKGIFLSRNFGQQSALNAGYDKARGNYVVTLDCDLQNPPAQIRDLYLKAKEGYDIVFATRRHRPDTFFMTQGSHVFNKLMGFLTDTQQDEAVAEFALFSRKVINAMKEMGDYHRYYPLMSQWVGFRTTTVDVEHAARTDGRKSSYSMKKRIELAVTTAVNFSTKSLRLIVYFGIFVTLAAIIGAIALTIKTIIVDEPVDGWATLFVSMWFIAGVMIMIMGVIAIYIGSIFNEVKRRPSYIIDEILNEEV